MKTAQRSFKRSSSQRSSSKISLKLQGSPTLSLKKRLLRLLNPQLNRGQSRQYPIKSSKSRGQVEAVPEKSSKKLKRLSKKSKKPSSNQKAAEVADKVDEVVEKVEEEIVVKNLAQAPGISNPEPKEEAIETLEVEDAAVIRSEVEKEEIFSQSIEAEAEAKAKAEAEEKARLEAETAAKAKAEEEEKALLEEARKEAGVIDKVVEKVEEPAIESRPVGLSRSKNL